MSGEAGQAPSLVHARRTAKPRGTALHVRFTTGDIPRRTEPRPKYPFVPKHLRPKHLREAADITAAVESESAGIAHDTGGHTPPHQPG